MYLLLRYTDPHVERPYQITGNNFGVWLVAILGLLAMTQTFIISFISPIGLDVGDIYLITKGF